MAPLVLLNTCLALETPISMAGPALHLDGQVYLDQARLQLVYGAQPHHPQKSRTY